MKNIIELFKVPVIEIVKNADGSMTVTNYMPMMVLSLVITMTVFSIVYGAIIWKRK